MLRAQPAGRVVVGRLLDEDGPAVLQLGDPALGNGVALLDALPFDRLASDEALKPLSSIRIRSIREVTSPREVTLHG
jgi:hypothetical protein